MECKGIPRSVQLYSRLLLLLDFQNLGRKKLLGRGMSIKNTALQPTFANNLKAVSSQRSVNSHWTGPCLWHACTRSSGSGSGTTGAHGDCVSELRQNQPMNFLCNSSEHPRHVPVSRGHAMFLAGRLSRP